MHQHLSVPILSEEAIEQIVERTIQRVLSLQNLPKEDTSLLTTQEVCEAYHISRVTLINYAKSGKLAPFSKAGKQHTYRKCDLDAALRHRAVN
jgi:hypothetical protein